MHGQQNIKLYRDAGQQNIKVYGDARPTEHKIHGYTLKVDQHFRQIREEAPGLANRPQSGHEPQGAPKSTTA
jgi:hypothetical protein